MFTQFTTDFTCCFISAKGQTLTLLLLPSLLSALLVCSMFTQFAAEFTCCFISAKGQTLTQILEAGFVMKTHIMRVD